MNTASVCGLRTALVLSLLCASCLLSAQESATRFVVDRPLRPSVIPQMVEVLNNDGEISAVVNISKIIYIEVASDSSIIHFPDTVGKQVMVVVPKSAMEYKSLEALIKTAAEKRGQTPGDAVPPSSPK